DEKCVHDIHKIIRNCSLIVEYKQLIILLNYSTFQYVLILHSSKAQEVNQHRTNTSHF
ncbi:unnamed protein product, partial [Schistosoma rodhaini]